MTNPDQAQLDGWVDRYLGHAPFALALREVSRLWALSSVESLTGEALRYPLLDVGCGDAFWWTLIPERGEVFGLDISRKELEQASKRIRVERSDITRGPPFAGARFEDIVGNCSLEHVRDLRTAFANLRRAATDDGRLILFVPTPGWAFQGRTQQFLLRYAPRLAMTFAGALNGFFQHWHLYEAPVWSALLKSEGWEVTHVRGMGGERSEFLFRLFLPLSFVSFLFKSAFGIYPERALGRLPRPLRRPWARLMLWALQAPLVKHQDPKAYEFMIVARASAPAGAGP